jgi:hypothetical protein
MAINSAIRFGGAGGGLLSVTMPFYHERRAKGTGTGDFAAAAAACRPTVRMIECRAAFR